MCYVIVTWRGLLWLFISLAATVSILCSAMTPQWLVGPLTIKKTANETFKYVPTAGIYTRCTLMNGKEHCGPFSLKGFATDSSVFPNTWKATLFFIALGLSIAIVSLACVILTCCFRAFCKKSLFSLAGFAQSLAAMSVMIGLLLYPWGWDSPRVQRLCGPDAAAYYLADCTLGWAFYAAIVGTLLLWISAIVSPYAEKAISSRSIEHHLRRGHGLICFP